MDWLALIKEFGLPVGFLMFAVWALVKVIQIILSGALVVPRWIFDERTKERDEWKAVAKSAAEALEHANRVANTAVRKVVKG